ncbi:MAG: hypothetical protein L3J39_01240 [Verrucomicrobiales bacterium]|nr:hypothetical protein [Verrucomicrobiales bacterium]
MQFLGEHSSFESDTGKLGKSVRTDTLFLWVIAIAVLIAFNAVAWVFCMYVFGHPETPFNYSLLTRVNKIDPLASFTPVTAPRGKFKSTKQLYAELYDYSPAKLKGFNAILKRNYLSNYKNFSDITYLGGTFRIESIKVLDADDVFPSGVAIRARADDYPSALIDYILPIPEMKKSPFKIGDTLTINRSDTCATLLHVEKLKEEQSCFTITPLVSRDYQIAGEQKLAVSPPEYLNLKGQWPISPPSTQIHRASSAKPIAGKNKVVVAPTVPSKTSPKN